MVSNIVSIVSLQSFTVFPEYFIALSIVYILIVILLITSSTKGLMLQKAISDCLALVLFMACYLMVNDDLNSVSSLSFHNSFINDELAFFSKFTICFFSAIYFFLISDSLKEQKLTSFEYLLILLFAILGLLLMCSSNDLLLAYLAIELSSLAFYVLASFRKTSSYSIESGLKYFITGAISSAFFLLGSSFLYGISGSISFNDFFLLYGYSVFYACPFWLMKWIVEDEKLLLRYLIKEWLGDFDLPSLFDYVNVVELGLTLILFSLFIKLALAPFHLWSLDVYEGSPTSSTIFFAVMTKLSIFILLIRLCYSCFDALKAWWQYYFLLVGVFSVFVGAFGGLKQRKLKTLLAYSSVSHMGYVLIVMGTAERFGIQMVLFYMIIYMLSSLIVWSVLLFLRLKQKTLISKYNKELADLVLLQKSNMFLAVALSITMFSMAGIPPLIGFLAKVSIFLPVISSYYFIAALASILFSVISTFYYIRLIKVLYFETTLVGKLYYPINSDKTVFISVLVGSLLFLFLSPTLFYLFCYKIILSLFV